MNPCEWVEEYHVGLRPELEDHVRSCGGCRGRLHRLHEIESALAAGETEEPRDARAAVAAIQRRAARRSLWKEIVPMATAAAVLAAILVGQVQSPTSGLPRPDAQAESQETLLVSIDPTMELAAHTLRIGPDGRIVVVRSGERSFVYEHGRPIAVHRDVDEVGPDYYVALFPPEKDGEEVSRAVVHKGVTGPKFTSVATAKSSDGTSLAYFGSAGEEEVHLLVDGKEKRILKGVHTGLRFVPGSRDLMWWSRDPDTQSWRAVIGDKPGPLVHQPAEVRFSPDGRRHAYIASSERILRVVVDGVESEKYEEVSHLQFSADGKTCAYIAGKWGRRFVVTNGKRGLEHPAIGHLAAGPDGAVAYSVWDGKSYSILGPGGSMGGPFQKVVGVWIHPNGKVFFAAGEKDSVQVFSEEGPGDSFRHIEEWKPCGEGQAFVASAGRSRFVVVNGRKGEIYDRVERLAVSPDGAHVAYRTCERRPGRDNHAGQPQDLMNHRIVVNERAGEAFDEIIDGPVFSADGTRVVFTARKGHEVWRKVVDVR